VSRETTKIQTVLTVLVIISIVVSSSTLAYVMGLAGLSSKIEELASTTAKLADAEADLASVVADLGKAVGAYGERISSIEERIKEVEETLKPPPPPPETVIKLGVIGPMTGPNADFGKFISNGVRMRVDEINAEGGLLVAGKRYPIERYFADTESKVEKGITAMEKLCTIDKVHCIVGAYHSSITVANCHIPQQYGIPFIDSGAMSIKIAEKIRDTPLPLVFQLSKTVLSEGYTVAQYLVDSGLAPNKKVALITEDSDYGRGDSEYFRKWLAENAPEIEVVVEEFVPPGEIVDWVPILTKIKGSGATWVGFTVTGIVAVSLIEAWKEQGLKDEIFLHDFGGEIQTLVAQEDWDKITYMTGTVLLPHEKFMKTEWSLKFKELFGYYPAEHDTQAYDAATAMFWAIEEAGTFTDGVAIAKALEKINIDGVIGKITFSPLEEGHVRPVRHSIIQYMPLDAPILFPVVWPEEMKDQELIWPPP